MKWTYYKPKFECENIFNDVEWPWAGHKFFAYDFVRNIRPKRIVELGTYKGTSFFSFCQAVKDEKLETKLYAVDSWRGDAHAGLYGEEIFEEVVKIKEKYYGNLRVELVKKFFDEAVNDFEDNSIDLLHIDGLHTYDAVKHDYEIWLPKMTENGAIFFHDVAEKTADFGVYKLWEELKSKYFTLEFPHSHGLGICFLSSKNVENLKEFEEIWAKYYELLMGKAVLVDKEEKKNVEISKFEEIVNYRDGVIEVRDRQIEEYVKSQDKLEEALEYRNGVIEVMDKQVKEQEHEREKLERGLEDKNNEIKNLNNEIGSKKTNIDELEKLVAVIKKSLSYKVGRVLTFPMRFIYEIVRKLLIKTPKVQKRDVIADDFPDLFLEKGEQIKYKGNEPVDIIVPVFNGYEYLKTLVESIVRNTKILYRLIIVDDCSPDEKVLRFEDKIEKELDNVVVIRHAQNGGFVKSVNDAVKLVKNHFVIINTDVEVPDGWLERMINPILENKNIASVTPFTNAGTICSFPNFLVDNPIVDGQTVDDLDSVFKLIKKDKRIVDVPTGVGFCMAFNFEVVKKIGTLDEDTFGRGYGEENDWCMRAMKAGYRNVMVTNLFVYHKHGGSFPSDEKKRLIADHTDKLNKKHPEYEALVNDFIRKDPVKIYRELAFLRVVANKKIKLSLVVCQELGGGSNMFRNNLIKEKLDKGEGVFLLTYDREKKLYRFRSLYKDYDMDFYIKNLRKVSELLRAIEIDDIFINSVVSYPGIFKLLKFIKKWKVQAKAKMTLLFHDFFMICPSYSLMINNVKYCGIPKDLSACRKCMKNNESDFRNFYSEMIDVGKWRKAWNSIFEEADKIVVFSDNSKFLLKRGFPKIEDKKIVLKPHIVDYVGKVKTRDEKNQVITVGILGAIGVTKGLNVVKEMLELIEKKNYQNIRFVVIGWLSEKFSHKNLIITGAYKKGDLVRLTEDNNVDIFMVPSVCPETFSYTVEEVIQMDMPLMVFDIGAQAERTKKYKNGFVASTFDAEKTLNELVIFYKKQRN